MLSLKYCILKMRNLVFIFANNDGKVNLMESNRVGVCQIKHEQVKTWTFIHFLVWIKMRKRGKIEKKLGKKGS